MQSESGFDCSFRQTNFSTSAKESQHSFRRHFGREFAIIIIILPSFGVCGNRGINRYAHLSLLSSLAVKANRLMKERVYCALTKRTVRDFRLSLSCLIVCPPARAMIQCLTCFLSNCELLMESWTKMCCDQTATAHTAQGLVLSTEK